MFRILLICLGLYTWNVSLTNAKILSQWRGLNRDGIYLEKQLLQVWPEKGPEMLWSVDGLGQGFSSPAVTSKQIFVTGMIEETGYVFAFDHNGELNWKSSYGPEWTTNYPGARSTPTVVDDYLYIESGHGRLVCFDAKTGKIVWDVNFF